MKLTLFIVAITLALALAKAESDAEKWSSFKNKHSKLYRSHVEDSTRFSVFQQNLRKIEEHNAKYENGEVSYYLAVTPFADLTQQEFSDWLKTSNSNPTLGFEPVEIFELPGSVQIPEALDYREERDGTIVSSVKNQTTCASGGWAFAAVGVVESAYAIKHNKTVVSLSAQQVIDCASHQNIYGQGGCRGGWPFVGIQYIADKGIEQSSDYPFEGHDSNCTYDSSKVVAQVDGYVEVPARNVTALKGALVVKGPCSIGINVANFALYGGGIFDVENCSTQYLQGLVVVGYGSLNGIDYWILKNSWGESFGENGYIRIKSGENMCGVEDRPICTNIS